MISGAQLVRLLRPATVDYPSKTSIHSYDETNHNDTGSAGIYCRCRIQKHIAVLPAFYVTVS